MSTIRRVLSESIVHIEDLPIDAFIDTLRNIPSMSAQEKLDGANLWVGVDEDGKFFTSREGKRKNADRRFAAEDWPLVSAFNQFRAAHAAMLQRVDDIKRILRPGDTVEAEVLFGRQPNSVTYGADGKSYIAFLRGVNGTADNQASQLSQTLSNQEVEISVTIVDTEDGEKLDEVEASFKFKFTSPQPVDSAHLKTEAHIENLVKDLETFLQSASEFGMTNHELMSVNLQKVDKEKRDEIKTARADVISKVQTEYKLPIKQALLDKVVRKIRSGLSDENLSDGEDIGIEGIVLRDPKSGDQIKIVDKDVFTTINKFNQAARQTVQSALNTVDPDAAPESRGGLMGEMRIRIAEFFGNRDLAKAANVRKALEPIKGASPEEAIRNFAGTMGAMGDHIMVKKKVLAIISDTAKQLKEKLAEFKEHQDEYHLTLKNGKEIGLSADTVKRTLLTFAEARRNLEILFDKVKGTNSLAQLLAILYGAQARAVHRVEELDESLLMEKKKKPTRPTAKSSVKKPPVEASLGDIDRGEYNHKDKFQILNAYLASVFMSMLIYHEHDTIGMRLLRDRKNMTLKTWSRDMSPLNHWGYVVWRNTKADVKKQLPKKVQSELFAATRHIIPAKWRFLHMDFSYSKDLHVDWRDHRGTVQRLIDLAGLRSDRLNSMLDWMVRWPELTYDGKVKAIGKLYLYVMQFIPRSTLFTRLRVIQQNLLLNATGNNTEMMVEQSILKTVAALAEDEGSAQALDAYSQPVSTVNTSASSVASVPQRVGNRIVVKRKRNKEVVQRLTMKFPDTRKSE